MVKENTFESHIFHEPCDQYDQISRRVNTGTQTTTCQHSPGPISALNSTATTHYAHAHGTPTHTTTRPHYAAHTLSLCTPVVRMAILIEYSVLARPETVRSMRASCDAAGSLNGSVAPSPLSKKLLPMR